MRASVSSILVSLGLAVAVWPPASRAQADRDFVFTDLVGHLVLRFVGIGPSGLDPSEIDEISDSEFSRMVHDRIRADLLFEDEPPDSEWAASMEPRIEAQVKQLGSDSGFSDIVVECRAASCRVTMQEPGHWTVPAHQAVLDTVQKTFEAFTAAHPRDFKPAFMLAAYDKEGERAHVEAFLRRPGRTVANRVDR
ncbi:MAG TPA: hypothetical protein VFV10_00310 [Gammaproteobacteria bacterium]|nr:hypothetical protein [Gammaproteobacteria bacterium]